MKKIMETLLKTLVSMACLWAILYLVMGSITLIELIFNIR